MAEWVIKGWNKIRARILERDNYTCRICHCSACDSDRKLNVHHIDYRRANNEDDNLITLCMTCHAQIHLEGFKPWVYFDLPAPWDR